MEATGKIIDFSIDFDTSKPKISLLLDTNNKDDIQKLKNEDKLNVEIKKEDIYKDAIKNVGAFVPFIVEEKAFETFKRIWEKQGLGYQVQETTRKDKCVRLNCYYGSSSYDTKEMSRLIDAIVQECKQLNIETLTPKELSLLKEEWGK